MDRPIGWTDAAGTGATTMRGGFHDRLIALAPRLRARAPAPIQGRIDAEDLVQDAATNALAARGTFAPGAKLAAWMHRVWRNRCTSDGRRQTAAAV